MNLPRRTFFRLAAGCPVHGSRRAGRDTCDHPWFSRFGRQTGPNVAQRLSPHAGTFIAASTSNRPTIKQAKALVMSEAHGSCM